MIQTLENIFCLLQVFKNEQTKLVDNTEAARQAGVPTPSVKMVKGEQEQPDRYSHLSLITVESVELC